MSAENKEPEIKEDKVFYIYKITNNINQKVYIGLTNDHEHRLYQYKWDAKHKSDNRPVLRAFNKYGFENFDFEVIATANSLENINKLEDILIKQYNAQNGDFGYNINNGGMYSSRTPETCQKISEALKKHYETHSHPGKGIPLREDWKKNISEGSIGKAGTNLGKTFNEQWCGKISTANCGKTRVNKRRFSEQEELEICRLYIEENKSTYYLGKKYNLSRSLVIDILNRGGVERRKNQYTGHFNGKNKFTSEEELEICKLFINNDLSMRKISSEFGCKPNTIRSILIRNNIDLINRKFIKKEM